MLDLLHRYLDARSVPVVLAMLALMGASLLAVGAAEKADPRLEGYTLRQGIWIVVALCGFVGATVIPFQRLGRLSYLAFGLNLALLVAVLFLPAVRNSRRWIDLKFFKLQPSELAKITYVMAMAWYLRYRDNYRRLLGFLPPMLLTLIPAVLILKEPDLGTTLLLPPTLMALLFAAGAKLRHLAAVVAVGAVLALAPVPLAGVPAGSDRAELAYGRLRVAGAERTFLAAGLAAMKPHQLSRITGWLRQSDPSVTRNEGFQLHQSMVTLGAGGPTGGGELEDLSFYFRMLPDDHTDFIYAVVGGQWGFVGCVGLLAIYLVILVAGVEIAGSTTDPFGKLLAVGVLAMTLTQVFVNVGMTLGLVPITGTTLPLVSYGGSSMLVSGIALGLLVNVSRHRPILLGPAPFEYDQPSSGETSRLPLLNLRGR